MKKFIFVSFFSCFALLSQAQDAHDHSHDQASVTGTKEVNAPVKKGEESLVVKEDVFDFGKIPQGKPVTHIFEIENSGKSALKLDNVQASCGCTTPQWDHDHPIAAGAKSQITVGYNAAAEGPFNKLVTISYNDGVSKQITIKGEVWKTPASSAPGNANLNELKDQ